MKHYCQQHPERGWTDRPCDDESHRHERFAKFLRELLGLPTEREIQIAKTLREDEKGPP